MQLDAQQIKQLRTVRGWTQQQLADICGLSLRTVQRVELSGIASLETTKAFAAAFECDRAELIYSDDINRSAGINRLPPMVLVLTFIAGVVSGVVLLKLLSSL